MACYTPLHLFHKGDKVNENFVGPIKSSRLVSARRAGIGQKPITVPCGRCIGCRLERSRQWAIRCMHELRYHKHSAFITLTYRDDDLVYGSTRATLVKDHLTRFWKRLRDHYGELRYFACGEYGEQTNRPHYHAIVYGIDISDKKFLKVSKGNKIFISSKLDSVWSHGDAYIGDVAFESCAYVSRYIMAKRLGKDSSYYNENGIEPEFVRMSRRPGIGTKFYEQFKSDIYNHDTMVIRGGIETRPPKFYDKKFRDENVLRMLQIKQIRASKSDPEDPENQTKRLKVRERVKAAQIRSLKRGLKENPAP